MITYAERKAAALAVSTIRENMERLDAIHADGDVRAKDLLWVFDVSLNQLVNDPHELNQSITDAVQP